MGETTAVAHGGNHGSCSWGRPRQLLMGETPKTALPPQDRTASPRPRCLPKTALPPQDRAASLLEQVKKCEEEFEVTVEPGRLYAGLFHSGQK
ncbi:MAG: hypothetical protein F6K53_43180 [Moorea sp. SIO4A1]|uniref:hypothetical protein n=1 Tax=Moorena sp. SIO4A1 TaxID=2607835 RepID=UPI00144EAAB7|nr:hypothetical protein [Moorena sp. SIO4A1]NEQ63744.1 hypothetical protein [Moorena sp. SIO4A1]